MITKNKIINLNYSIRLAAEYGDVEAVKLLLTDPRVNPADANNSAICYAAKNGQVEVVKLLLSDPRVNPSGIHNNNNYAILFAAQNGHFEVVKLLLSDSRVNPAANHNQIIQLSYKNNYIEIVDLLWMVKEVKKSLKFDNITLYNKLIEKELSSKIIGFN